MKIYDLTVSQTYIRDCLSSGFDLDDTSYQLISNIDQYHSAYHLDEALERRIKDLTLPHRSPASSSSHGSRSGAHDASADTTLIEAHEDGG